MADRGGRRWPWVAAAAVSVVVLVVGGWWLVDQVSAFGRRPLSDQDSIASVTSMVIGAAALLVAMASLVVAVLQLRRERTSAGSGGSVQVGTAQDGGRLFMVADGDVHLHGPDEHREDPS
ncbi:hypothetical protein EIL87_06735 [Saccharopolyspora rhizosphaerae]|uniref:Uncharacterized protein n=1 Tax=Saccharopolyspora rhizosphaerae TaxID=2492662 RepID=A0A426JXJ2_9PSEU|nr:hypothetical protein [Saccharopolyspora rhizosphaerae]RRO17960.1 hypothetical protein EIL87_06735 [Saccharopolyspora rhizosphaerae]